MVGSNESSLAISKGLGTQRRSWQLVVNDGNGRSDIYCITQQKGDDFQENLVVSQTMPAANSESLRQKQQRGSPLEVSIGKNRQEVGLGCCFFVVVCMCVAGHAMPPTAVSIVLLELTFVAVVV